MVQLSLHRLDCGLNHLQLFPLFFVHRAVEELWALLERVGGKHRVLMDRDLSLQETCVLDYPPYPLMGLTSGLPDSVLGLPFFELSICGSWPAAVMSGGGVHIFTGSGTQRPARALTWDDQNHWQGG